MPKINWLHLGIGAIVTAVAVWLHPSLFMAVLAMLFTLAIAVTHGWTEYYFRKRCEPNVKFEWVDDIFMFMPAPVLNMAIMLLRLF